MNVQLPVETLVLDREAATDQLAFTFQTSRLAAASDGKGGFVLTDDGSVPRFHVLPPTVTDATCKTGKVTLTLTDTAAVLTLDPTFAATAIYPMTIDPPVNWTTYPAYTTLGYDALAPLSELTVVSGDPNDPTQHQSDYTYDRVRNRLTRKQGQLQPTDTRPTTSYSYDKADRLLSATTGVAPSRWTGGGYAVRARCCVRWSAS